MARVLLVDDDIDALEIRKQIFERPWKRGRKVRSPQGSVPANGRGGRKVLRKVPQKIYRLAPQGVGEG